MRWPLKTLEEVASDGLFTDGDWIESKDQDPAGAIRLTQVADVGDGNFRDRSDRWINDEQAQRLRVTYLSEGDVLVSRLPDPLGRSCVFPTVPYPAVTAVDVSILRVPSENPRWVSAMINAPQARKEIASHQSGSTRRRISRIRLGSVVIPVPPRAVQDSLVEAIEMQFSLLDSATQSLEQAKRNVERARASILKAAVEGRLVPTEAELARKEGRDYEHASVLLERMLTERKRRHEEEQKEAKRKKKYEEPVGPETDDLPKPPEGWVWASLNQLGSWASGGTPSRKVKRYYAGEIPWVKSGELEDSYLFGAGEHISSEALDRSSAKIFPPETLLVAMYGATIGMTGVLRVPAATNQACAALLPSSGNRPLLPYVRWFLIGSREAFRRSGIGGAQPNISQGIIKATPIPLPPLAEQRRIVDEIDRRFSIVDAVEASIDLNLKRCERLRQAILKWAFEGRLVQADTTDAPPEPAEATR